MTEQQSPAPRDEEEGEEIKEKSPQEPEDLEAPEEQAEEVRGGMSKVRADFVEGGGDA